MTPREILRDYMTVLNILMQNESTDFAALAARVTGGASGGEAVERTPDAVRGTTVTVDDILL